MTRTHPTAGDAGLIACHTCHALYRMGPPSRGVHAFEPGPCPRCGSPLHHRKPESLSRTLALLITSAVLYIPANFLPVMTVIRFGRGEPDTIMSGVQHLIEGGMWPLALVVFVASIVVPLLKLTVLSFLVFSVRCQSRWRPRDRTVLYRIMALFGHWSMVDIFLISILVALVQMGAIATIEPGPGATFFGGVVVLTLLAAHSFDPRLIWDASERAHG